MKKSIIFWNLVYIIGLIILGIYSIEILGVLIAFKSLLFLGSWFDDMGDMEDIHEYFPAFYLNFTTLIAILGCGIGFGLYFLWDKIMLPVYNNTIGNFNKFLNK